jgi:hypothetical protein
MVVLLCLLTIHFSVWFCLSKMLWNFLKHDLVRVVPLSFFVGASMELFMIKTGFYEIVTRKEAERRAEYLAQEQQRLERIKRLNLDKYLKNNDGTGTDYGR